MEKIAEIINDWDPIGFFPMAPKDEYVKEVEKIYGYICSIQEPSIDMLAEVINGIFMEAFGADVYDEDMEQCTLVAKRILSKSKA